MSTTAVNFLPASIRIRLRIRQRNRVYVSCVVLATCSILVGWLIGTHRLDQATDRLAEIDSSSTADDLDEMLAQRTTLTGALGADRRAWEEYQAVAATLPVSRFCATVFNAMLPGMGLDSCTLDVGQLRRTAGTSPRPDGRGQQRYMVMSLSGFAPDDDSITGFMRSLQGLAPCEEVNLDFIRWGTVRERDARVFRISFRVDLSRSWLPIASGNGGRAMVEEVP